MPASTPLLAGQLNVGADTLGDLHLADTSLSIFDAAPPHALQLLSCTKHLDEAERDDAHVLSGG